jgi:NAD(P)-dependent dehydrogenase (short-subunit alcohol dehydrogenase family)
VVPGRFEGSTVVVTGAASGIGRAVASRVAREGGTVVAVDLSQDRLAGLVVDHPGAAIRAVGADITSVGGIDRIIEAADVRIDALANVAGLADEPPWSECSTSTSSD